MIQEKEELQKLVNDCNSLREILTKQGKAVSGAAIKILKEKLDTYEISYHFINKKQDVGKKLELSEILKENRPYRSAALKQRLIKEGLKEDKCEICGQLPEWNGKELVLQLDHINGDHNDNRLENLRILCPNCHTQTETFGNKRRKEIKLCPDCGCEINNKSQYCRKCGPKHRNINFKVPLEKKPSKEELFEMIKTMSFVRIAEKYGVTDSAVRKWCKKYKIPDTKRELRVLLQK